MSEPILLIAGIACILAGLAWWRWTSIMDKARDQGVSLGLLEGRVQFLGSRIGCNLEDEEGLKRFMEIYEEHVSASRLPESPELRRTVFQSEVFAEECERWRMAGIAMWYVMGMMRQRVFQDELRELLHNLYEQHGHPTGGIRAEIGERLLSGRDWRRIND